MKTTQAKRAQGKRASQKRRRKSVSINPIVLITVVLIFVAVLAASKFGMFEVDGGKEPDHVPAAVIDPVEDESTDPAVQVVEPVPEEPEEPEVPVPTGIKVCLDPGHGGNDPGCNTDQRKESDDVLALALAVRDAMEAKGIEVVMTRSDDTYISLDDRCVFANSEAVDYFISIHRNAVDDSSVCGVEVWKSCNANDEGAQLADNVNVALESAGVQKSRGVHTGSQGSEYQDYQVLRETTMPGVLIEMGFIKNEKDNQYFDENQQAYAEALAQAVLDTYQANHGEDAESSKTME